MTLCDAGAMLYKLSFEATQLGAGQFVVPVMDSMNEINVYIAESLWSHQIGGIIVYNRQLLKSVHVALYSCHGLFTDRYIFLD